MAGIYIHIPFCRQACRYCDFHFNISLSLKKELIQCIIQEIENRKDELSGEIIKTIYFGGGTPSVLKPSEAENILHAIYKFHNVIKDPEISFEANPEDLTPDYLQSLKHKGINRLSIGIQSFFKKDLELMRRSHTVSQSLNAVRDAIENGYNNINIDLIFGITGQSADEWITNISTALNIGVQHISAYHLSFEPGTVFDHWRKKGRISPVDEEQSLNQLKVLILKTSEAGFDHYEISNFALPGFISVHNTNYWKQVNYLGVGPSAHSYNGIKRRWNISNNLKYVQALQGGGENYYEYEHLSKRDLYNEYILTSLRTKWGIDMGEIAIRFGNKYVIYVRQVAEHFINNGKMESDNDHIKLKDEGIFLADYIISELFMN